MLFDNTAFIHADPARRQMQFVEIAVIVGDHDEGGASLHHFRQQFVIKFAAEFGILLGGPFVEDHDRPLFQHADDQREAAALAAGQIERAKLAVDERGLVGQAEFRQQAADLGGIGVRHAVEPLEQMVIEENRRHQAAIFVARWRY